MSDHGQIREVRRVMLTKIVVLRGCGTEADRYREVVMIFDDDGTCLAEHDPIFPTPWYAPASTCRETRV